MDFSGIVADVDLILTEGSMYERLRRNQDVTYDPHIAHSSLIYSEAHAEILAGVHREYIAVARDAGLPMIVGGATWKANRDRLAQSRFADQKVNRDNVAFVKSLVAEESSCDGPPLFVAAGLGPRGNAYGPEDSMDTEAAARFHSFQADRMAEAEPDVLFGFTFPAISEALGAARALEATGLPYMMSFVVRDTGVLLDGTGLGHAFDRIDQSSKRPPLGYFVNCVHSSVLDRAVAAAGPGVTDRLLGFRANTSDLSPEQLDGAEELITEAPEAFGAGIAGSRDKHGLTIVGGCCGSGTEHIEAVARLCGGER